MAAPPRSSGKGAAGCLGLATGLVIGVLVVGILAVLAVAALLFATGSGGTGTSSSGTGMMTPVVGAVADRAG